MKAYPDAFERDQGCTEAEWLRWLPGAVHGHAFDLASPGRAIVTIGSGHLALAWHELPPRVIALIRLPRLHVGYCFVDVDADARDAFMRVFDLHIQRGGG